MTQADAQRWRMAAQDDSDMVSRVLNNMKDAEITEQDLDTLTEAVESLRRNIDVMKVALGVDA